MMVGRIVNAGETIAAIATATGPAGVGIIRISGRDAFAIADRLTRSTRPTENRTPRALFRATVYDPNDGEAIDDGLLVIFPAPHSFTGENVVEFQGHGGTINLTRLLSATLTSGARLARPGEFSERAFLSGKLDLAQAEAIADMISAQTVQAQRVARRQLSGELSSAVEACKHPLAEALARIEASIDFPDDVGPIDPDMISSLLTSATETIHQLLSGAHYGRRLRDGITIVLTGRPNVGKSSLLNALSGTERAIVTPIPGTTRDIVEEAMNLFGIPVRAMDTAGLRESDDLVERIGVERARRAAENADIVVAVFDLTAPLQTEDRELLATLQGRPAVIALNKSDRSTEKIGSEAFPTGIPVIPVSALTSAGIDSLARAIADVASGGESMSALPLITSARHETALRRALLSLQRAQDTLDAELEPELISVDIFASLAALGEITGQTAREEIIAGIFSRFCIGK